jgi:hypothetical protein
MTGVYVFLYITSSMKRYTKRKSFINLNSIDRDKRRLFYFSMTNYQKEPSDVRGLGWLVTKNSFPHFPFLMVFSGILK